MLDSSITTEDLKKFQKNYHKQGLSILESAITTNGIQTTNFNWHAMADNTP